MAELPDGMPNISDEQLQKLMDQLKEMTEEAEAGGSIPGGTPPPIGRSTYGVMGYDNMYLFFTAIVIPAAVIGNHGGVTYGGVSVVKFLNNLLLGNEIKCINGNDLVHMLTWFTF
ncbi:unnamed protein product [Owenia fusiformis]|uniref:Uncharacterized protein n=1 Tax=Owenia fusiformis TaxID=6347 RepID=A0A8S4P6Z2_OWEFU|nr:unnamed protein product [Owenia fusiformis]